MRIGIDARELCRRPTGVGRYLGGLLGQWACDEAARAHEFVLYADEPIASPLDTRRFAMRLVSGRPGTWWEQVTLPRVAARDHLDVFFSPGYTAPLALRVPLVVAIHDVSFAAHPQWFTTREGVRRRWLCRETSRKASAVITISRFSRGEIVERLGAPPSKVHLVPPGVTPPRTAGTPDLAHPLVLFVGSIFNRRHVPDLIRAFGKIARRDPRPVLELVGDNRTLPHQDIAALLERHAPKGRARWRLWVDEEELGRLYGAARAFAFLSEYEGLGLTPLEALAARVPPLLVDTPVARESCGPAAIYVAQGDVPGAAQALEQLLFDEAARAAILCEAPGVLARYSWLRAARDTLTLLERAG
jgi:glycosyltransferase involved in cell wall biosynthesis